jgi:hypothetical protein
MIVSFSTEILIIQCSLEHVPVRQRYFSTSFDETGVWWISSNVTLLGRGWDCA